MQTTTARRWRVRAFVAAFALAAAAPAARAEIIDRILAVVDGQLVTLSDVHAARRFGLVAPGPAPGAAQAAPDPIEAVMRELVDRHLMLAEVQRYSPPEPPAAEIDKAMADVRSRFADEPAFAAALEQTALSRDELRRFVRDSIRIDTYIRQRFSSVAEPSEDDVVRYYKEHAPSFTANGVQMSFDQARSLVRQRIVEERQRQAAGDWLEGLRRRGTVSVLYLPNR